MKIEEGRCAGTPVSCSDTRRKEAREKAQELVFINMNRGDIEEACRKRGIKVTTNRSSMEGKLIEALTEEFM